MNQAKSNHYYRQRERSYLRGYWPMLLIATLFISGCRGCTREKDKDDNAATNNENSKPAFKVSATRVLPSESELGPGSLIKPGHSMSSKLKALSNHTDFTGSVVTSVIGNDRNSKIQPFERFVSLPKETEKELECVFQVPLELNSKTAILNSKLVAADTSRSRHESSKPVHVMDEHQFHVVVLSNRPEKHQFWETLDCIQLPKSSFQTEAAFRSYYVVYNRPMRQAPFPTNPLNWTTIAYVVWNDYEPDNLSISQQNAMLDWLHWGGQLIVSGPDAIASLRGSFLDPYLPATDTKAVNLSADEFQLMNDSWSIKSTKSGDSGNRIVVTEKSKLSGLHMSPRTEARFVYGTGQLVVEVALGRGRIVMTGFQLSAGEVNTWPGFPGFVNGALFLKPARKFVADDYGTVSFKWDSARTDPKDSLLSSSLRFCSRDLGLAGTPRELTIRTDQAQEQEYYNKPWSQIEFEQAPSTRTILRDTSADLWHYGGFNSLASAGTGAMNNSSAIPITVRDSLIDVAGIQPPERSFVIRILVYYLICLVPLNWLVFRLAGRLEWAWIAAPLISIMGAFAVVRAASLDIGFSRSQHDIALLEIYGGYPRAHCAQFSSLYSSLSTDYLVESDADSAITMPFDVNPDADNRYSVLDQGATLKRFHVQSNSARLLHHESFIELGGTIDVVKQNDQWSIVNDTFVDIHEAAVIHRGPNGKYQLAWIGKLPSHSTSQALIWKSGESEQFADFWTDSKVIYSGSQIAKKQFFKNQLDIEFGSIPISHLQLPSELIEAVRSTLHSNIVNASDNVENAQPDRVISYDSLSECLQKALGENAVHLGRMFDKINTNMEIGIGQTRLIGWSETQLDAITVTPQAQLIRNKTLVLVHLTPAQLPQAQPDANLSTSQKENLPEIDNTDESFE